MPRRLFPVVAAVQFNGTQGFHCSCARSEAKVWNDEEKQLTWSTAGANTQAKARCTDRLFTEFRLQSRPVISRRFAAPFSRAAVPWYRERRWSFARSSERFSCLCQQLPVEPPAAADACCKNVRLIFAGCHLCVSRYLKAGTYQYPRQAIRAHSAWLHEGLGRRSFFRCPELV